MGLGLGLNSRSKMSNSGGGGGGAAAAASSGAAAAAGMDEDGLPTSDDEDGLTRTDSTVSHIPSAASIRKSRNELSEMLEESGRKEEQLDKSGPVTAAGVANDVMTTSEAELKALAAGKPEDAGDDEDEDEEEEFGVEEDVTEMQMGTFTIEGYNALEQRLATEKDLPPGVGRLNRYFNILPNPATRVKLAQVPGTDETTKYVNANFVMNFDGSNMKQYIASQGPMATARSVADFWRMVWETDCRT